jgi:hypothetical protein
MTKLSEMELTAADIRVLATLIYEPVPRVWINGYWCCPHCLQLNARQWRRCECGLQRDAIPREHTEEVIANREPASMLPEAPACFLFADHERPPLNAI